MTEAEWLACDDTAAMLRFLRSRVSDRKLRLFACASARLFAHLFKDARNRRAVEVAERFADGLESKQSLSQVRADARAANWIPGRTDPDQGCWDEPGYAVWCTTRETVHAAAREAAEAAEWQPREKGSCIVDLEQQRAEVIALLRDVVGNPFRSGAVDPSWLAWNGGLLLRMAQRSYDERRFGELPVLADALEEAGCTDPALLGHCWGPGKHVRGCWVLDLLLGKE
jgi:hypothetical protein